MNNNIVKFNQLLKLEGIRKKYEDALGREAGSFIAAMSELYSSTLSECDPVEVLRECLKAASLRLPLGNTLGYCYIIPYRIKGRVVPQFQLGYKGLLQLCLRSSKYKIINVTPIPSGLIVKKDYITGKITIEGEPNDGGEVIGYLAYMQMENGFEAYEYMTKEQAIKHAERFSKTFQSENSPWKTDFDAMACKTVLKRLLSKYGVISIDVARALIKEEGVGDDSRSEHTTDNEYIEGEFMEVNVSGLRDNT